MFNERNKDKKDVMYTEQLNVNIELTSDNIKKIILHSKDIKYREIIVRNIKISIFFIEGLIDNNITSEFILKPLKQDKDIKEAKSERKIIELIQEGNIYYPSQVTRISINDAINDILTGNTVLVFDEEKTAISFDNKGFEKRSITEPSSENIIKGSKDAFVETLRVNTSIIRRKIRTHNLRIEELIIGERTHTPINIIYIGGIANKNMIEELRKRLESIKVDGALTTGIIEEHIMDKKYTLFPQILYTERSDKFCSNLLEGRVGLIVDGIPSSFILPCTFLQCLQAPEDYSQNYIFGSFVRLLRFGLMAIALILPSFYTAITTFHQEMIPTKLATFIQIAKEGVPFPTFIEVILMLIAFEILIEAGLRLPKYIGQAVSIVGAIIVGQAAVEANLVSPAVLVIVAVCAISSFAMPIQDFSNAIRIWRLILVVLSSIIGIFGMTMGLLILLLILCNTDVLGVPYLSPFIESDYIDIKDSIIRMPFRKLIYRPYNLKTNDRKRGK